MRTFLLVCYAFFFHRSVINVKQSNKMKYRNFNGGLGSFNKRLCVTNLICIFLFFPYGQVKALGLSEIHIVFCFVVQDASYQYLTIICQLFLILVTVPQSEEKMTFLVKDSRGDGVCATYQTSYCMCMSQVQSIVRGQEPLMYHNGNIYLHLLLTLLLCFG